jgi:hypothetical protein
MSLPYTIDDHFTFGYNNIPFSTKSNFVNDRFFCRYSRCEREPGTFKEECVRTAVAAFNQAVELDREVYIFLSGGLDSEVVVKAFLDAGVAFKTISFRFKNNLSSHEEWYINKFVRKHNIPHEYYEIDPQWLKTEEAEVYCKQSTCVRAEMLPHMKLLKHVWDNLKGFPILGNGDLYVSKEINKKWLLKDRSLPKYEWLYIEYEYIVAWFRFAIEHKILGAIGFFQQNPYIVLAMIRESRMQECFNDQLMYKLSCRSSKPSIYKKYWPDLLGRVKYHGGEQISGICIELNRKLSKMYSSNSKWSLPIKEFEKLLSPIYD